MNLLNVIFKLLTICLLLLACSQTVKNQTLNNDSQIKNVTKNEFSLLDSLYNVYKQKYVNVALYYKNKTLFAEYTQNHPTVEYCSLGADLEPYIENNQDLFAKEITLDDVDFIEKWCSIEQKILSITPMESDTDISVFEVVYQMKNGKQFFANYLKSPKQYYKSLSYNQECSLFYDIIFHLAQSEQYETDIFFNEYITIYNVLKNNR